MTAYASALLARLAALMRPLPDWVKGVILGVALALILQQISEAASGIGDRVEEQAREISATKARIDGLQSALERIDSKVDRLLLHLVPAGSRR